MELVRYWQSRFHFLSKASVVRACVWSFVDCRHRSDYSSHENSRVMQKLLNKKGAKGKRKWYRPHIDQSLESWSGKQKINKHGISEAQRTRARQIGHVLYDKITHLINTGELCPEILNKQVLITSVKMQDNFAGVNVYWDSSRSDGAEVEALLQAKAGKLRSLLISYHVLGRIPPVTFVKDRTTGDLNLFEQLLEIADYGPDYIPSSQLDNTARHSIRWSKDEPSQKHVTDESGHEKQGSFATSKLTSNSNEQNSLSLNCQSGKGELGQQTKDENDIEKDLSELTLKFRSNVYNLPHGELMKKVLTQRTKVKFQGGVTEPISTIKTVDFYVKHLKSVKDKAKQKSMRDSTKVKQNFLQRGYEDSDSLDSSNKDLDDFDKEEDYVDDDVDDFMTDEDWSRK